MKIEKYVQALGSSDWGILHAVIGEKTLCGRSLNWLGWFIDSPDLHSPRDVNCTKCQKVLREEELR